MIPPNLTISNVNGSIIPDLTAFDPTTGAYLIPAITYSDNFAADTSIRYQTVTGTVAYNAGKWLDLTIAAGAGNYVRERLKDYQFGSGGRLKTFTLPASCDNGDYFNIMAGATGDLLHGYGLGIIRTAGVWNVCTVKDITVTDTGTVVSGLSDGGTVSIELDWDAERAVLYGYVWASGSKPASPSVTVYDATYQCGYTGFVGYNAGAGSKVWKYNSIEIRARCLIGLTNIPATQAAFSFTPAGLGQFTTTGTWTFTGSTLTCTSAGNAVLPFQAIGSVAGSVHTFTPTLANGTDYFYFGEYRLKFVASGGNSCVITLQTAAGVTQGTGSLTVTTSSGAFANPVMITNYGTSITVTVSGATGSISSGTTTATGSQPYFTVGTAPCSFANYSFSGTRYYWVPMLRGAQAGQYYDGTNVIPCLRFSDDFNWNTILEYYSVPPGSAINTTLGYIAVGTQYYEIIPLAQKLGSGWLSVTIVIGGTIYLIFGEDTINNGAIFNTFGNKYYVQIGIGTLSNIVIKKVVNGVASQPYTGNATITTGALYNIAIYYDRPTATFLIYCNGILIGSWVDPSPVTNTGYWGFTTAGTTTNPIRSIQINALDTLSTNGSAISIAGWAHGGSMGAADWAGLDFIKDAYAGSRDYSCAAKYGMSTVVGGAFSFFFEDKTSLSAILASGGSTKQQDTTTGTAYATFSTPTLRLGPANNGDEIFCGILGTMAGATPPIYLTELTLSAATQTLAAFLDSISSESSRLAISQHLAASLGSTSGITARLAISQLLSASLASTTDESARLAIGQLLSCDLESTSDLYANLYLPPAIRGEMIVTARKKTLTTTALKKAIAVSTLKKVLVVSEG
jgi:hypothetical protein